MNPLSRRFPEIYRCLLTECSSARLALGAGTSLALGAAFWSAAGWDRDPGKMLFLYAFWTQVATFIVYGSIRASASIADEREAKTWDLQRLTPLTSGDIAAGKLLGAPVYAAFLAALLMPWALVGALRSQGVGAGVAFIYLQFAATAFLALSLALLSSAYSDLSRGGSAATAGTLIGLGSLYTLAPALVKAPSDAGIVYFGLNIPNVLWMPLATAGFGAWAFAAAKWRVGRDLLEPARFWRFPAFLLYLIFFLLGFEKASAYFALLLPAAATVMTALAEPTTPEAWRRWLAASDWGDRIDRTPSWISGAAVCVAAALFISLIPAMPGLAPYRRLPLVLSLFLVRDAAFIQACRFTKSRRPEILAVVFLSLAYLVPLILLSAANMKVLLYAFMPLVGSDVSAWVNVIPGLIGALASVSALAFVSGRSTSTLR
ncbi:MAG: hypothetical protein PHS14_07145 [Elusimicrobia bacterium]|nr:hypothetical protein [Elusimicrobiota bacterium]